MQVHVNALMDILCALQLCSVSYTLHPICTLQMLQTPFCHDSVVRMLQEHRP